MEEKIIFLHFEERIQNRGMAQFYERDDCICEDFFMKDFKRESLLQLMKMIKNARMVYIHYDKDIDITLIKHIEAASILQNTIIVYDHQYHGEINSERAILEAEEEATTAFMKAFVNSSLFSDKQAIPKSRDIFINNTLIARNTISDILDGQLKKNEVNISVITSSNRRNNLEDYIKRLNDQNCINLESILLTHGFTLTPEEKEHYSELSNFELKIIEGNEELSLGECLNRCLNEAKYEYVTKMDDDDFYSPHYLIDSWIALQYSNADMVGKNASFVYLQSQNLVMLRHGKSQYRYVDRVIGGSLFGRKSLFNNYKFGNLTKGEDSDLLARIKEKGGIIYAGHPYETCLFRAKDQTLHTWKVSEVKLLSGSVVMSYGSPIDLISMDNPVNRNIYSNKKRY